MANLQWNFSREGSVRLKDSVRQIIYHKSLNVVIVLTQDANSIVVDVNSGSTLHKSTLVLPDQGKHRPERIDQLSCLALPEHSALIVASDQAVGLRQDLGQVLLLESILQVPVSSQDALVRIELPTTEAVQLLHCLQSLDLSGEPDLLGYREQIAVALTQQIRQSYQSKTKFKAASWGVVHLDLPLYYLRTLCLHAVQDMRRHNRHVPALPVASAVAIRTAVLLGDNCQTGLSLLAQNTGSSEGMKENKPKSVGPAWKIAWDKVGEGEGSVSSPIATTATGGPGHSWMVSEAVRRETFNRWPHMKYKWALPAQMAEAGFYHQPNTPESDRAVCFHCNVCLICWEPNDEPWSEHERHAPLCQFVKGEYTQNVPMETTLATYPALMHSERGDHITCLSTVSSEDYAATASDKGLVVLWNISGLLRRELCFKVDCAATKAYTSTNIEAMSVLGTTQTGEKRDPEAAKPRPCLVVGVAMKPISARDAARQATEKEQMQAVNDANHLSDDCGDLDQVNKDSLDHCSVTQVVSDLCLLVYDVCQPNIASGAPSTDKDQPDASAAASAAPSGVKSGFTGASKKQGIQSLSTGTQQECNLYNQNRDMFYSVNDDALVDEMVALAKDSGAGPSLRSKLKKIASFSYEVGQASSAFPPSAPPKASLPQMEDQPSLRSLKEADTAATPQLAQKINLTPFLPIHGMEASILSLTPSHDGQYLLVVVGPKPELEVLPPPKAEASFPTLLTSLDQPTPSLMSNESQESQLRALWDPTPEKEASVARDLSSTVNASDFVGALILLAVEEGDDLVALRSQPVAIQRVRREELPVAVVMLPRTRNDTAVVLVGQDGQLRLYDLLKMELKSEVGHEDKFVSATYCTNAERLCASTGEGMLCFYRVELSSSSGEAEGDFLDGMSEIEGIIGEKGKGKGKAPLKLLIHQPLTLDCLQELQALTDCENIPQGFSAVVPPCWMELPQAQKLRRQPQPLRAVGDEAHHTRTWRMQPEGTSWDEHLLEICIPQSWTIGHIDVRFTLMPDVTCVPAIQVSLLERRSSGKSLGKNKAWAADDDLFTEVDRGLEFSPLTAGNGTNPVLTNEFLEMHDAALLCGPIALDACLDGTGHNGIVTLASPLLLAARSRNYLIHFKYLPQVESQPEQDPVLVQWPFKSNGGSKSALERLSLGGARRPSRGCDVLQEISVCVRKTSSTSTPRDKLQRYMMVSDANFVGKLRDSILREPTTRACQNLALDILIWIVTVCSGIPDTEQTKNDRKVAMLVLQELSKNVVTLIDRVWIKGYRTSAKKMAKLVLACLQLGKDTEESKLFQKQLLEAQLNALPQIVSCTSPTAVYWFTVVLSRLVSWDPSGVSNVAWSLLIRVSQMYQARAHPLHLLLQARFGLYGKPFEPALFTLPALGGLNMDGFLESSSTPMGPSLSFKDGGSVGFSTAAVAGRIALDGKFSLSSAALAAGADGGDVKQVIKRGCGIPQFLAKDFNEAEPLVVTLCQASEGTRLEKLDTGPSAFGSTSSAGFVKTNSNSANGAAKISDEPSVSFRWEHLLRAPHSYAWLLERLHSGGRKFVTLDLGQPVLLTDVCIPACPEFVCLAVDVWLEKEETDGCRLTLATDIATKPIVLLDLQPPPLCRYIKLSVVGRYGMSTTFVKANLGLFYGHTVLLPNDIGVKNHATLSQPEQIRVELDVVEGLADQVMCHYHLASSKLQTVLWPLLDTRRCDPVASHVEHYLRSQLENPGSLHHASKDQVNEADKVFSVYEECLKLQLQWNTLRGVARRLRRALGELGVSELDSEEKDSEEALDDAGSDKLQFVAHSLVNLLLCVTSSQTATRQDLVNEGACRMLFERLLVAAPPALQLSGASLLSYHCGSKNWWGDFLAKIVQKYLAFQCEDPWPQDRIFLTLTFMAHKTLAISTYKVLDAIGQSLCQSLDTLDACQSSSLTAELSRVDLSAVNWHLLFINHLLDRLAACRNESDEAAKENVASAKSSKNNNWSHSRSTGSRWDFLQGEFSLNKVNPLASSRSSAGRLFRRKLQKRLFHHKQQWEELELKKVFESPASDMQPLGSSKKAFSSFKTPFGVVYAPAKDSTSQAKGWADAGATSSAAAEETHRDSTPVISWHQAVLLARKLVHLLLLVSENQQLDLILLIAKVLGKLAVVVRPVLHLGDIVTTQSLVKLLQIAVKPSTTFGDAVDHQWMSHAITCLLRDFLSESKNANHDAGTTPNFVVVNPANVEDAKELFGGEFKSEGAVGGNGGAKEDSGKKLAPPTKVFGSVAEQEELQTAGVGSNTTDVDLLVTGLMEGASDFTLNGDVYGISTLTKPQNAPGVPGLSTAIDSATQNGALVFENLRSLTLSPEHLPFLAAASLPTTSIADASSAGLMVKQQTNGEVETFISKLLDSYPAPSDSFPKPPNSSRVVRVFPVKEDALNEDSCLSNTSSASDNRLETRVEGCLGQKMELFCLLHQETVYQALVSPVTANEVPKASAVAEDSLPSLCTATNISMLSLAFNQVFTQYHNTMATEAIAALRLWMQINLEVSESSVHGVYEAATVPVIILSSDTIRNLLAVFARQPQMEVGSWCTLFQAISWLCNLRCTTLTQSIGAEVPSPSLATNGGYVSGLEDLAGGFLAGGILRDASLVPLLHNFLSGNGLPPSSNGDRCWVGPTVTSALSDLLMRLRLWCSISTAGSRLGTELRRSLLGLVLQLCQPGGAMGSGRGPLDAQLLLLDSMLKLVYDGADTPTCIALVDAIAVLVCNRMKGCQPVTSSHSGSHVLNPFVCFGGLVLDHASKETVGSQALTTSDHIFASLLQLAAKLANIPLAPVVAQPSAASTAAPLVVLADESLTDSSKIEQAEHSGSDPQTDERKVEQQNERSNHNRPVPQSTFLADLILQQPSVILALLSSLTHCQASPLALTLGPATLSGGKFPFGDPASLGDHVVNLLLTLLDKTTSPHQFIPPLCSFFTLSQNSSGLSDPLLWFVLHALNTPSLVEAFRAASGVALVASHVARAHVALANHQPGLVPNMIRYLGLAASQGALGTTTSHALSALTGSSSSTANKVSASLSAGILNGATPATASTSGPLSVPGRKSAASALESVEGLLNFAPLGSIASSNPSAQPADALLVSVPPHRRARTPAWSHHFYPSEHWVELTVTLPCAVLLHEVQLQPHLTSLATCPAAIALEVSAEGPASLSPVSGPVNTAGLAFITLKLPCPQIAHTVLIRLYRPRDSSNVGLAQLRVLGSLAIPTGPVARTLSSKTPGVHPSWIHLLHHCVETATPQPQNAILSALVGLSSFVKGCCAHFVTLSSVGASTSPKSDLKGKLHSLILRLSRFNLSVGLQCLQWFLDADSGGEGVAHLVYELCLTRDEFMVHRLQCLLRWLLAVVQSQVAASSAQMAVLIHCAAAVLWAWQENTDVASLVAPFELSQLAQFVYAWSLEVDQPSAAEGDHFDDSHLKKALDFALCTLAYMNGSVMDQVLTWMGVGGAKEPDLMGTSLTDDSKGNVASAAGTSSAAMRQPTGFLLGLKPGQLSTLARTAQSPLAARKFFDCGVVKKLAQFVMDFCRQEAPEDHASSSASAALPQDAKEGSTRYLRQRAQAVTQVLRFFTQICTEGGLRNLLIEHLGPHFMSVLIATFCSAGYVSRTAARSSELEDAVVRFLQVFCWAHRENQRRLAQALYAVLSDAVTSRYGHPVLTGFTRRLFFQLVLETEKLYLFIQSSEVLPDHVVASEVLEPRHPKYGVGPQRRLIEIGASCTAAQVLDWLTSGSPPRLAKSSPFFKPSEDLAQANGAGGGTDTGAKASTDLSSAFTSAGLSLSDQLNSVLGSLNEKRAKSGHNRRAGPFKLGSHLNPFSKASIAQSLRSGLQCVLSNPTLHLSEWPGAIPGHVTVSQLYTWLERKGKNLDPPCIHLNISFSRERAERMDLLERVDAFPTILQDFAGIGGLALLAQYLPLVTADMPLTAGGVTGTGIASQGAGGFTTHEPLDVWVKIEENDDFDDEIEEIIMSGSMLPGSSASSSKKLKGSLPLTLPQHSLVAFSLFLRIPLYADALLRDRRRAQMLLRLALGVCDDGEGGDIVGSQECASLPILPFSLLKQLLITQPPSTDDGFVLRKKALEVGALQLLLGCLGVFTQQLPSATVHIPGLGRQFVITAPSGTAGKKPVSEAKRTMNASNVVASKPNYDKDLMQSDEEMVPLSAADVLTQTAAPNGANGVPAMSEQVPQYWAKGTGFGTGSTAQSWDVEEALLRQKAQEEHTVCLMMTLAAYLRPEMGEVMEEEELVNPETKDCLPEGLAAMLNESCLLQAVCCYLRNDSVMDMARHVPLYKALLLLVRAIAQCSSLSSLLCCCHNEKDSSDVSIFYLLGKMKDYVSTYSARIAATRSRLEETDSDGGLAELITDITTTWACVEKAVQQIQGTDVTLSNTKSRSFLMNVADLGLVVLTPEQRYMDVMRKLQFETFEMLVETEGGGYKFTVPFHFEGAVRLAGERSYPTRMKRLAQEAATLLTSLPLSFSSSVFVRCDTDRLDVMKVLITGPADTPYANGCYEFDVYFPVDYPQSPMQIHLCTTGRQTVRFNPNLYNDGKVCLSVLNTWHGRPEEKWNPSTSSFLQVLVSIQSLILVSEPYFNEPGYERSRGTPSGTQNSRDYDANIRQANVRWAMLEQLKNPSACFKDVVRAHFWLKREEIERQIEDWLEEMETQVAQDPADTRAISISLLALERHYSQLKEEMSRLPPPDGVEEPVSVRRKSKSDPEECGSAAGGQTAERNSSGDCADDQERQVSTEGKPSSEVPDADNKKCDPEGNCEPMLWSQDYGGIPSESWTLGSDEDSDEFDSFISQFII